MTSEVIVLTQRTIVSSLVRDLVTPMRDLCPICESIGAATCPCCPVLCEVVSCPIGETDDLDRGTQC